MNFNDAARQLIGSDPATLVTVNRDGSAQVSVVWLVLQKTVDGDDELVTAHLSESQKVRNMRRDPRVQVTLVSTIRSGPFVPYLSIKGRARIEEGGAPELLEQVVLAKFGPGTGFPPAGAPPGFVTLITVEKISGVGTWTS
jgi:PPOX class probable F420-dependent enzyme